MSSKQLIEKLVRSVGEVPKEVAVLPIRQYSQGDLQERAQRLLALIGEIYGRDWGDQGDWLQKEDRTLIRLTEGARAMVIHASGAMKLSTGLSPMEIPFPRIEDRDRLGDMVKEMTEKLQLPVWAGEQGDLRFERLWQIKAAASDREGKVVDPVLFRIVGAFRHYVNELPVWGPASVALKLAGDGSLDTLTVQVRETIGEEYDRVQTLSPEHGASHLVYQLEALMGPQDISLDEVVVPHWMHFGYLSLNKRKAQRLLEPVYVALVDIEGQEEAQGYLLVTNAGHKTYEPVCRVGDAPSVTAGRREA
jgi:hypothetical protein